MTRRTVKLPRKGEQGIMQEAESAAPKRRNKRLLAIGSWRRPKGPDPAVEYRAARLAARMAPHVPEVYRNALIRDAKRKLAPRDLARLNAELLCEVERIADTAIRHYQD